MRSLSSLRKPKIRVRQSHSKTHPFVVDLRPYGKGRRFFKFKSEAEAEAMRQKTLLERHSREAIGLSQREMSDFIAAKQKIGEYGETIADAIQFRVEHLERVRRHGITVEQFVNEVIKAKHSDGRSEVYLRDLRYRLDRFSQDFGSRAVAGITVDELDSWLRALPYSPQGRMNFRRVVGLLFSNAESRGIIDRNPILRTGKPKLIGKAPDIFTVDELRSLFTAAVSEAPDVLPVLAIGAFAGLRDAEIKRLHWNEVDLARGFIEVTAAKAKTARRRLVPIQPNLAAWLRPYSGLTGNVVPANARNKVFSALRTAGLARWPINGLRHSFASYRLAATHDAPRVASELGHTSPALLYSHYRELVRPEEAERYWKIVPAAESEKVVAFSGVS
jgi:integrase